MRTLIACLAFASADPEPEVMPSEVIDVTPEAMATTDGVPAELRGAGTLAEARVLARGGSYHIELRDHRGWTGIDLGLWPGNGTFYTLEAMHWVDVVGDADPELWVAINSY